MSFNVTYNGVKDVTAGVHATARPAIPSPMPRADVITIPGQPGDVYLYESTNDIIIPVTFNWVVKNTESDFHAAFRNFKSWIYSHGSGELSFSDDPATFFKCKFVRVVETQRPSKRIGQATVEFTCEPFTYLVYGKTGGFLPDIAVEGIVGNPYNVAAHPVYVLTGSGACTLTVNGKTFAVNLTDRATINTDKMTIQGANLSWVDSIGDYEDLYLNPGENTVSVTEGFQCWITPHWRCL